MIRLKLMFLADGVFVARYVIFAGRSVPGLPEDALIQAESRSAMEQPEVWCK